MVENTTIKIIALQSAIKNMNVATGTTIGDAIKAAKLKKPKGAEIRMNKMVVNESTLIIPGAEICIIPRGDNGS